MRRNFHRKTSNGFQHVADVVKYLERKFRKFAENR